ncbi:MAG: hypothetical protein ACRDLF_02380 [Solirubrobacteraceae bacterium]
MRTITIPRPLVGLLRGGLYLTLQAACEDVATTVERRNREDGKERYTKALKLLDHTRALLDWQVGWAGDGAEPVTLPVAEHRDVLVAALREELEAETGVLESLPAEEQGVVETRREALLGLLDRVEAAEGGQ